MNDREDTVEHWQRTSTTTWNWVWPIAVLLTGLWMFAPRIETWVSPVLGSQQIGAVVRTPSRLCWERVSFKYRTPTIDNIDVFLDRLDTGDRSFPEIFSEDTGLPLHRDGAVGVGWSRRRSCILIPPDVRPDEPIRLRQILHYRGVLALWDVPWALPDIVSPPGTVDKG